MTLLLDLGYVAFFAIVLPIWDYFVSWPSLQRQFLTDPARARKRLWTAAIGYPWALVTAGATWWALNDRPWSDLGFTTPTGWRWWVASSLVLILVLYFLQAAAAVARDPAARASVQHQFSGELASVLPRTRRELQWFGGVSLTAGFCEEFLYRGYFIWALSPWLAWWGAAAVSLVAFAAGHAYQGWQGVFRTGLVGSFFTGVIALLDSLWPVIVLHALVDLGGGLLSWLALRDPRPSAA